MYAALAPPLPCGPCALCSVTRQCVGWHTERRDSNLCSINQYNRGGAFDEPAAVQQRGRPRGARRQVAQRLSIGATGGLGDASKRMGQWGECWHTDRTALGCACGQCRGGRAGAAECTRAEGTAKNGAKTAAAICRTAMAPVFRRHRPAACAAGRPAATKRRGRRLESKPKIGCSEGKECKKGCVQARARATGGRHGGSGRPSQHR